MPILFVAGVVCPIHEKSQRNFAFVIFTSVVFVAPSFVAPSGTGFALLVGFL